MDKFVDYGWGSSDRYYSGNGQSVSETKQARLLADQWKKILELLDPDIEKRIHRAYKQWNLIIRDQLRNETALRLSHGDQQVSIPVRIVGGIPDPLVEPLQEVLGIAPLLLRRESIRRSMEGMRFVHKAYPTVLDFVVTRGHSLASLASEHELESSIGLFAILSAELDKIETLQKVWGLRVDGLGAYFFRRPDIELYWLAIGIMGLMSGIEVESVTFVTLTHELAHAYTHMGRDIDGNKWETENFAQSDDHIVEGLAQHYTKAVCQKLSLRYPAPLAAFELILKRQSSPYTCFTDWIRGKSDPGEHVRQCMLVARKQKLRDYDDFLKVIGK